MEQEVVSDVVQVWFGARYGDFNCLMCVLVCLCVWPLHLDRLQSSPVLFQFRSSSKRFLLELFSYKWTVTHISFHLSVPPSQWYHQSYWQQQVYATNSAEGPFQHYVPCLSQESPSHGNTPSCVGGYLTALDRCLNSLEALENQLYHISVGTLCNNSSVWKHRN